MYILVKNYNGRLIFICDDQIQFDRLLNELTSLLKKSFFKHKDFFPKAFFDFKSRIISEEDMLALFRCLIETKCIIFGGFVKEPKNEDKKIKVINGSIHGGEVLYIDEDTLITGAVNPGAIIYLKARLYILKEVYGTIEGIHETAQIYSKYFKNATIRFFGKSIHNFTSFTMSVLYYKDNEIVCDKEESVNV
ncbi:hypothetical protein H5999_02205 [[Clostridium] spiroforme]|nr:hypothetical protein [Thomasclavelia spiroformis]